MEIKGLIVGPIETNCYLLISKREMAIVDPGGEPDKILDEIEKTGLKPKYIINTHHHFDHTLANKKIKKKTGAEILVLKEGDDVIIGDEVLKVINTPGHSKDSICLLGRGFALTGDTLFRDGYGRTDLRDGSEIEMQESLNRLSKLLKSGTKICPGHGEIFEY
jgi:glyoxylase-like metal-dependent hydrolase (beta-lactamase superfamily II)